MNEGDWLAPAPPDRACRDDFFAAELDRTGIAFVDPGKDLDQRRLAGPVLTQQGQNLARPDVDADVIDSGDATECLDDVDHRQDRGIGCVGG